MGYNTSAIILNDAIHMFQDDKDIGNKIYNAVMKLQIKPGPIDISVGGHVNAMSVCESHHSSIHKLMMFGGNACFDTGTYYPCHGYISREDLKLNLLKEFANEMGYTIRKKPIRK